tara:strand:+ start:288 stop:1034 length:747 start_codon:yes stop_codon:yes gene_type:complete
VKSTENLNKLFQMEKIKIVLGITYLCLVLTFLMLFLMNFSLNEITEYDFIKTNSQFILNLKNSNLFISILLTILFIIIWVLLLGFGSPVALLSGYIFGKWLGTIIAAFSLSIGALMLYLIANFFFKDLIKKKFSLKYIYLIEKFKKQEFLYFFIYRFVGGIPFFIANILPTLFNIKIKNYFFGTLFGIFPQIFIMVSMGSGIEKIISNNLNKPSFYQILSSPNIYYPIIAFIIIFLLAYFTKKIIFKK